MKNILTLLLGLVSACLLGQTKEEAFAEMNAILTKLDAKTITRIEGDVVKIAKQSVFPEYMFLVKSLDIIVGTNAKDIPWGNYTSSEERAVWPISIGNKFRQKV